MKKNSYTIYQAEEDIASLRAELLAGESQVRGLIDEVSRYRNEEFRSLRLYNLLERRVKMLEEVFLLLSKHITKGDEKNEK